MTTGTVKETTNDRRQASLKGPTLIIFKPRQGHSIQAATNQVTNSAARHTAPPRQPEGNKRRRSRPPPPCRRQVGALADAGGTRRAAWSSKVGMPHLPGCMSVRGPTAAGKALNEPRVTLQMLQPQSARCAKHVELDRFPT